MRQNPFVRLVSILRDRLEDAFHLGSYLVAFLTSSEDAYQGGHHANCMGSCLMAAFDNQVAYDPSSHGAASPWQQDCKDNLHTTSSAATAVYAKFAGPSLQVFG